MFVTGFHRAGTHTFAKELASKVGLPYVEEGKVKWDDFYLAKTLIQKHKCVIQCPGLAHKTLYLAKLGKVYWCDRDKLSIVTAMRNGGIDEMAWHIMNNFYNEFPDDPIWDTLEYDGSEDQHYGFVKYKSLLVKVKEHFYQTKFKDVCEYIKLEDQDFYDFEKSMTFKKPLRATLCLIAIVIAIILKGLKI